MELDFEAEIVEYLTKKPSTRTELELAFSTRSRETVRHAISNCLGDNLITENAAGQLTTTARGRTVYNVQNVRREVRLRLEFKSQHDADAFLPHAHRIKTANYKGYPYRWGGISRMAGSGSNQIVEFTLIPLDDSSTSVTGDWGSVFQGRLSEI